MSPFTTTSTHVTQPLHAEADPPQRATWFLPSNAASAQSARHQVACRLRIWGFSHVVDDAELIVSELITNAVCHGAENRPVWHTLRREHVASGEVIRIEVGDCGQGWTDVPTSREAGDDTHCNGRGLLLVEALASSWGSARLSDGHVVWAVLPSTPGASIPNEPLP